MSRLATFRVTVESVEDAVLVRAVGEVDASTAGRLRQTLEDARRDCATTLLDLAGVSFIDSAGLHVLLDASGQVDAASWALFIVRPSPVVQRLVEITETADRLPLVPPARAAA
jgi:anti-sigma B factor antagonist